MNIDDQLRSFDWLGGQCAPLASHGTGVRILYRCPDCQRIWLQDGRSVILDVTAEQVARLAREVRADPNHLPASACRLCLWKNGNGVISVDEYGAGEGFGICWEIRQPVLIHAISALQSQKIAACFDIHPDVLTQVSTFRAVLDSAQRAPQPALQELPRALCRWQAQELPPGLGQPGWHWQGWCFTVCCPPLDHETVVTFMVASPPKQQRIAPSTAFALWQRLLEVAQQVYRPSHP